MALGYKNIRFGTEADWLAVNPILESEEEAYVIGKGKKRGDGVKTFSQLDYTHNAVITINDAAPAWNTYNGTTATWAISGGDKSLTLNVGNTNSVMRITGCAGQTLTLIVGDTVSIHNEGRAADNAAKSLLLPPAGDVLVTLVKTGSSIRVSVVTW